jgi:hypothetical protein
LDHPDRRFMTLPALWLVVGLLLPTTGTAEPVEFGVFTPRLHFATPQARDQYAGDVATVLSRTIGHPVHGRAFANASDLTAFIKAGRLDIALVDAAYLAGGPTSLTTLADGTGPDGRAPPYAVLAAADASGVNALEGQSLALPKVTASEAQLLSNYVFEGELSVATFFGRLQWSREFPELLRRIRSRQAAGTIAYLALAEPFGLRVVAPLKGMPLPVLVEVGASLGETHRDALRKALSETGLELPQLGPLTHLVAPQQDATRKLKAALALSAGQRPVRRAIWTPLPVERLSNPELKVGPRARYPLQTPVGRWRMPEYPDIR